MGFDIKFDLDALEREMQRHEEQAPKVVKEAVSAAGGSMFATARRLLVQLIYNKEIPFVTRKRGKDKGNRVLAWLRKMRAGGLLGAETYSISSDGTEFTIHTEPSSPAAKYVKRRHELDRPSRIDGKVRRAPWRREARAQGEERAREAFRNALRAGFKS